MVNHKKFMDIERIKEVNVNGFEKGDYIVIQEKNRWGKLCYSI